MVKRIMGIDPGINGGIAIWAEELQQEDPWIYQSLPMIPTGKGDRQQLDIKKFAGVVRTFMPFTSVAVEIPPIMPKNGSLSIAGLHRNYGNIQGVIETLGLSVEYVPTKVWQKVLFPGLSKEKGDKPSVTYVLARYPQINIAREPKKSGPNKGKVVDYYDGISDAVCICEYARRIS